jgi:hypothetical protein
MCLSDLRNERGMSKLLCCLPFLFRASGWEDNWLAFLLSLFDWMLHLRVLPVFQQNPWLRFSSSTETVSNNVAGKEMG